MAGASSAVAVLGAGSWGTALAALIARHGHRTVLWGRDAAIVEAIDQRHENPRYLPGIALPEGLRATIDLAAAMRSEEHTSELQSLMRISYAVFCLKKKKQVYNTDRKNTQINTHQI